MSIRIVFGINKKYLDLTMSGLEKFMHNRLLNHAMREQTLD